MSRLLRTSGRPDRARLSVPPRIVPVEEALHSRPGAVDEDGYSGDDAVDDKESDFHALLDIASFSVDFLWYFGTFTI